MTIGSYNLAIGEHGATQDVRGSISVQRGTGLNLALSPTRPSQLNATLRNDHGEYNPGDSTITKGDETVLTVDYGDVETPLFRGYLDQPHQDLRSFVETTGIRAYGPLARMANKRRLSSEVYANITTDAAIGHVLDAVGWPEERRDLDTGVVTLRWWWLEGEPISALNQIVVTEGITAMLYESASGDIVFRNRFALFSRDRSVNTQTIYGSAA